MKSILTVWITCFLLTLPAPAQKQPAKTAKTDEVVVVSRAESIPTRAETERIMADFEQWQREQWATKWKLINSSHDKKTGGQWFFKTARRNSSGDTEVWVKMVPYNLVTYRRLLPKTSRYTLQFITFHCGDERYSLESTLIYDGRDQMILNAGFFGRSFREPIIPDSVIEGLYNSFCGD
jgi:hypothetical protein